MEWMTIFGMIATIQCVAFSSSFSQTFDIAPNPVVDNIEGKSNVPQNNLENEEEPENVRLDVLKRILFDILLHPEERIPLILIDDVPQDFEGEFIDYGKNALDEDGQDELTLRKNQLKRSRFYRKYPWKRQNSRETYDAENRYLCQPTREDVFRLLVALHESRTGNRGHVVNFCNRKRPATSVFTNIRFLGKK